MKKLSKIISLTLVFAFILNAVSFAASAPSQNENYPYVYDLQWENRTAKWSKYGKVAKYEVVLFTDNRIGDVKTTKTASYNFASAIIDGDHQYYFKVRAYNNSTGWSVWEQSPSINFNKSGGKVDNYIADPMKPIGSTSGNVYNSDIVELFSNPAGIWIKSNDLWFFQLLDGTFAVNRWINSNGLWYYVNGNGVMVTGLLSIDGKTYFFNESGVMQIGQVSFGGQVHVFGTDGAMVY